MEANNKNLTVVMTEKDYFKIKEFNLNNLHYLKVSLEIEKKEKLIKKIITLHETD
jgi:tetraacyldisaccharide-1-P 4'-kinase